MKAAVTKEGLSAFCTIVGVMAGVGCQSADRVAPVARTPNELTGRTYYIDGAGNWGYGVREVEQGLRSAGYRGEVINYTWSPTLNPALDQTFGRPVARAHGRRLAREISRYLQDHPAAEVNIIALSAGTGVAVWACENLDGGARIRNLILLGSSLSANYDLRRAMAHIHGDIYVYHSTGDAILQSAVRVLGTIDGRMAVDSAGLVGLQPTSDLINRVHNVAWREEHAGLGWRGGHTDVTSEPFVRTELAQYIVPQEAMKTQEAAEMVAHLDDDDDSLEESDVSIIQ